jgi:flagellar hook-length control protein FliK
MDAAPRKQNGDARNETFTAAGPAKPGGTSQISGKIAFDAAINADAGHISGESIAPELPAGDFRALMERAMAMAPGATGTAGGSSSTPSLRVDTPLGQTGWHEEMGQKLTWMVGNNRQQADLVLNPPQLGRIEVSLTMNGDQATAIFTSPNPAVREALENSLHRLREVLADAGVSLGQAQVGSESPHQSSAKNEPDFGMNESVRYASAIPLPGSEPVARSGAGRSMIDIFA